MCQEFDAARKQYWQAVPPPESLNFEDPMKWVLTLPMHSKISSRNSNRMILYVSFSILILKANRLDQAECMALNVWSCITCVCSLEVTAKPSSCQLRETVRSLNATETWLTWHGTDRVQNEFALT